MSNTEMHKGMGGQEVRPECKEIAMQVTALCDSMVQAHLLQQPELDNAAFPLTLSILLTLQKNEQNVT